MKIHCLGLKEYKTGWDKRWERIGENLEIQAHAPSIVRLEAAKDCTLQIQARVKPGGKKTAVPCIQGQAISYGQTQHVALKGGEELKLEFQLEKGGKDQCWNFWTLQDAGIAVARNSAVSFWKDAHLGDSLGMVIACENFGRENQVTLSVRRTPLFGAITELFEFNHVRLVDEPEQPCHVHPFGHDFERNGWIGGIICAIQSHLGGEFPGEIRMPGLRAMPAIGPEDIVLFQLDGRSQGRWTLNTYKRIIANYAGMDVAILGGPDTKPYLGNEFDYRCGDLRFLCEQLLACRKFVGVDSGVAHLACVLGVDVDVFCSPTSAPNFVGGLFGNYPAKPKIRTVREVRPRKESAGLLLVSTTNGWNLGDDLIREGVFKLLDVKARNPIVWINRCQMNVRDDKRNCPWSPQWRVLRNFGDPQSLVEQARALVVAGTPEWIDTIQPFYALAAKTGLPIWIVGVGGGQWGQLHHLKEPIAQGVATHGSVRDETAMKALQGAGMSVRRFLDPAFHSYQAREETSDLFVFNPQLSSAEQRAFYGDLYQQLKDKIDIVSVHEPTEYSHAVNMFAEPVFYNSDYRRYIDLYRSCQLYVGGRMHGSIPSLISGAAVHLISHEQKHNECAWWQSKLACPEAFRVWQRGDMDDFAANKPNGRFDQKPGIAEEFEAHQAYLRENVLQT